MNYLWTVPLKLHRLNYIVLSGKKADSMFNVFSPNNTRTSFKGQIECSAAPASCFENDLMGTEEKL